MGLTSFLANGVMDFQRKALFQEGFSLSPLGETGEGFENEQQQTTLRFPYHPKTQRGLCPCRVPTSAKRTKCRFRQSRSRRE